MSSRIWSICKLPMILYGAIDPLEKKLFTCIVDWTPSERRSSGVSACVRVRKIMVLQQKKKPDNITGENPLNLIASTSRNEPIGLNKHVYIQSRSNTFNLNAIWTCVEIIFLIHSGIIITRVGVQFNIQGGHLCGGVFFSQKSRFSPQQRLGRRHRVDLR